MIARKLRIPIGVAAALVVSGFATQAAEAGNRHGGPPHSGSPSYYGRYGGGHQVRHTQYRSTHYRRTYHRRACPRPQYVVRPHISYCPPPRRLPSISINVNIGSSHDYRRGHHRPYRRPHPVRRHRRW